MYQPQRKRMLDRWPTRPAAGLLVVLIALAIAGCPGTMPPEEMPGDMPGDMTGDDPADNTGTDPDETTAQTVTVRFDGAEGTSNGTTDFSFMGANFTGGTVRTVGNPSLYGSGLFAYEVREGSTVLITFDQPVDRVELFFVRRGTGTTVLNLLDETGGIVGAATANPSGTGSSVQTVPQSKPAVTARVIHTGDGDGWIDDFAFRPASASTP